MDAVSQGEVPGGVAGEVEPVGLGEAARVPVGGGQGQQHGLPRGHGDAADGEVLDGEAPDGQRHRAVVAGQFLHRPVQQLRIRPQRGQLRGMGEQRGDGVADEMDGVLVSGDEDEEGQGHQLVLAQAVFLVAYGDERGEQVVARAPSPVREEAGEEGEQPADGVTRPGGACGVGCHQRVGPGTEVGPAVLGDAQEVADHGDRQRGGVGGDQVELLVPAPRVEEPVRDASHGVAQLLDAAGSERLGDQPADPRVVRRVHVQQVGVQRGRQSHAPVPAGRAVALVQGQAPVGEGLPYVVVAGDQPGGQPVRTGDAVHRPFLTEPAVDGVGIGEQLYGVNAARAKGGCLAHEASQPDRARRGTHRCRAMTGGRWHRRPTSTRWAATRPNPRPICRAVGAPVDDRRRGGAASTTPAPARSGGPAGLPPGPLGTRTTVHSGRVGGRHE